MRNAQEHRVAELRAQILASTPMCDGDEASAFLGLPVADDREALHEIQDQLLMFNVNGRELYPLFQFNVKERALHSEFVDILKIARAHEWSAFRLTHWMISGHVEFDVNPASALPDQPLRVKDAFLRAVEPQLHG